MAAAEIMNLHTNFFDEVYESNFMMKGKKSEENENIETKNVNSTLFTSKVNNTFVDKSKLLRISSVDSSEDQIVSSSDFERNPHKKYERQPIIKINKITKIINVATTRKFFL